MGSKDPLRVRSDGTGTRGARLILDAAAEVFLEEGFAAASMSAIAARVGGSKGTLYNYFRSKEELFEAYIQRHCAWQAESMFALLTPDIATARRWGTSGAAS